MGFIAYQVMGEPDGARRVRVLLECQSDNAEGQPPEAISYSHAVDVEFLPGKAGCTLHGVDEILVLKKFYKLAFSLEERAREHGHDWQEVFQSEENLVRHLDYTRNARRVDRSAAVERRLATVSGALAG